MKTITENKYTLKENEREKVAELFNSNINHPYFNSFHVYKTNYPKGWELSIEFQVDDLPCTKSNLSITAG